MVTPAIVSKRTGLTIIGGSLRSSGYHSAFVVSCSSSVTLRGWSIVGSHPNPGTYVQGTEDAHGVEIRGGTDLHFESLSISNMQGDGFYFAQCGTTNGNGATVQDSSVTANGRMGIAVVAFNGVIVLRMHFHDMAFRPIDVEPDCNPWYQTQARDLVFDGGTVDGYIFKDANGIQGTAWLYIGTPTCSGSFIPSVARVTVRNYAVNPTSRFGGLWTDISPAGYRISDVLIERNTSEVPWTWGNGVIRARDVDGLTVQDNREVVTSGPFVSTQSSTGVVVQRNVTS